MEWKLHITNWTEWDTNGYNISFFSFSPSYGMSGDDDWYSCFALYSINSSVEFDVCLLSMIWSTRWQITSVECTRDFILLSKQAKSNIIDHMNYDTNMGYSWIQLDNKSHPTVFEHTFFCGFGYALFSCDKKYLFQVL